MKTGNHYTTFSGILQFSLIQNKHSTEKGYYRTEELYIVIIRGIEMQVQEGTSVNHVQNSNATGNIVHQHT